jgi:hypothetical protein
VNRQRCRAWLRVNRRSMLSLSVDWRIQKKTTAVILFSKRFYSQNEAFQLLPRMQAQ